MDTQTRIEIMADIENIMETDTTDNDFLRELLQEMQEAY